VTNDIIASYCQYLQLVPASQKAMLQIRLVVQNSKKSTGTLCKSPSPFM